MKKNIKLEYEKREKEIIKTSLVGIFTNLFLTIFKGISGILSNSIAIILDAVNNLSDLLSSVVTIIGQKLSSKKPDKKHPMGYGRIEYITSMVVAGIIVYAGIKSVIESIKKIIVPQSPSYDSITLIILIVGIISKYILGRYFKKQGNNLNSISLIVSGTDALADSVVSLSVLISAFIYIFLDINIESYVGIIISIFLLKSGFKLMLETLDTIIGKKPDKKILKDVKNILLNNDDVIDVYDLVLFNYGPNKTYCTAHIELIETMTVEDVENITRKLQYEIFEKTGIILISLGVYAFNTKNNTSPKVIKELEKLALENDDILDVHGFKVDEKNKKISFDIVLNYDSDFQKIISDLKTKMSKKYDNYDIDILADFNFDV